MKRCCRSLLVLLLTVGCVPACAGALHGQYAAAASVSREDSARAHRAARSRQATFERVRRAHLPDTWGGGGGECDERIGRFCLTYSDEDAPEWEPPEEEPEVVARARARLLDELDAASLLIPGDGWVVGQRVRYLLEQGRFEDARFAAAGCRAEAWWCDALTGFAAHEEGRSAEADAAYSRMLERMPAELRRRWTDLGLILQGAALRHYRRLPPEERPAYEERFWRLADPLLGTPGNDARSEHLTRNVLVRLLERSETTDDLPWGDDLREILIRFGAPSGHERVRRMYPALMGERASLVSHYPDAELDLVPPPEMLTDSFLPTAGSWEDENRRPRAAWPIPRGAERLRWTPLPHQMAVFRDGDTATVVAAYDLSTDTTFEKGARLDASLAVWRDLDDLPPPVRVPDAGARAVLTARAPAGMILVSLETVTQAANRAARVRLGAAVTPAIAGVLSLSDLLLFDPPADSLPETRAGAAALARGSTRVKPGERVGVYWELYGLAAYRPETLRVSLRLVEADAGWLRRLAQRVGVAREEQPIRLVWGEEAAAPRVLGRSLALQVPEDVGAGRFALELTVAGAGREPLVARRELEVAP